MAETTVFQSGNSQAVRLPKDFRFKSKTVEIFRRGNEVVLREKPRTLGQAWDAALQTLPELTEQDKRGFDEAMTLAREARAVMPQQERDWSWLETAPEASASPKASTPEAPKAQKAPKKKPAATAPRARA